MKIESSVYESLKSDIRTVLQHFKIDLATTDGGRTGLKTLWPVLTCVSRCRAYDDAHPGFSGGHWPRVLPYDGRDYTWYYSGNCNDTHLATALRKVKAELLAEALASTTV